MSGLDWQRIEPTTTTKVGWRNIVSKTFKMPDGSTHTWDTIGKPGDQCAGVIALTPDYQVITAYQYRPGQEAMMHEIPGGIVEPGEDPADAAKREFMEETGYKAGSFEHLGIVHKDAMMNATFHYYLARGCVQVAEPDPSDDPLQFTAVRLLSIADFLESARQGRMTDAGAVFLAYDTLLAIQKEA